MTTSLVNPRTSCDATMGVVLYGAIQHTPHYVTWSWMSLFKKYTVPENAIQN
jgi:hypothetical protein